MSGATENTIAIAELTVIAKQTTKDLDRIIKYLAEAPIARTIALEKRMGKVELRLPNAISKTVIMWGVALALGAFGTGITFAYTEISGANTAQDNKIINITTKLAKLEEACKKGQQELVILRAKHEK